jgi:transketolase
MIDACKDIRKEILKISEFSGHGHIPSCFSVVESLYAVYANMKHSPQNPQWEERDIFILSKGHAALTHYCVLSHFGYFPIEDVYPFGAFGSDFGCHADRFKIPGIEASTGSLGHGIGLAVGMALAFKMKKTTRKVYTIVGDGESNEGTIWEALLVADNLGLDNLTIIYDNNMSHARGLQITNPGEKFKAFGCHTVEVDGHDVEALQEAFVFEPQGVKGIIANTVKGFGCHELSENHYAWHRRSPTAEELGRLLEELDAQTV